MTIRFDEKGKFFTEIVPKNVLSTVIQTINHKILGQVHVGAGQRLKDELNGVNRFIAVTDASVIDNSGQALYKCSFMVINCEQIIWAIPMNEIVLNPQIEPEQEELSGDQSGGGEV